MTPRQPGAEARLHLLEANREAISVMLAKATAGGLSVDDAVVVVVDQRDPVGRELGVAAAEKAGLDAHTEAERVQARGEVPTAIIVVPVMAARAIFGKSHPTVASGLRRVPVGRVRTVVIAEGGAMLVALRR